MGGAAFVCGGEAFNCGAVAFVCGKIVLVFGATAFGCGSLVFVFGMDAFVCGTIDLVCGESAFNCGTVVLDCGSNALVCGSNALVCGIVALVCCRATFVCGAPVFDCGAVVLDGVANVFVCGVIVLVCGTVAFVCGTAVFDCGTVAFDCGGCFVIEWVFRVRPRCGKTGEIPVHGNKNQEVRSANVRRKKSLDTKIHKRIKAIRIEAGKSHLEMAQALGVSISTYHKYEGGACAPSPATMMSYVQQYDFTLEWLMLGRGPKHFNDMTKAFEDVETLREENEGLKRELQEVQQRLNRELQEKQQQLEKEREAFAAEKKVLLPEGAAVITEKDLVELFQYLDENTLFKYELLTHFHKYKAAEQKNLDVPALGT